MTGDLGLLYIDAVEGAYKIAYSNRRGELAGRRFKRFDDRGLDPYSEAWGRIGCLEALGGFVGDGGPVQVRHAAEEDADAAFRREIRDAPA